MKVRQLELDIAIRWNSTFDMLKRAYEMRIAVNYLTGRCGDLKNFALSDEEWRTIEEIINFLQVMLVQGLFDGIGIEIYP